MEILSAVKEKAQGVKSWATSKVAGVVAVATAGAATMPAHAQAVDVSDVVTTITAQLGPIGLIGVAVLGVMVAIKAYKWVSRAL